jgi:hypothetical protein
MGNPGLTTVHPVNLGLDLTARMDNRASASSMYFTRPVPGRLRYSSPRA